MSQKRLLKINVSNSKGVLKNLLVKEAFAKPLKRGHFMVGIVSEQRSLTPGQDVAAWSKKDQTELFAGGGLTIALISGVVAVVFSPTLGVLGIGGSLGMLCGHVVKKMTRGYTAVQGMEESLTDFLDKIPQVRELALTAAGVVACILPIAGTFVVGCGAGFCVGYMITPKFKHSTV
jgi:uncharacterized membrane protein (Fun14 family)